MSQISRTALFLRAFLSVLLAGSAVPRPVNANEQEEWSQTQRLGTAEAYFHYLRRNPTGEHIDAAVAALTQMGALGRENSSASPGVKLY